MTNNILYSLNIQWDSKEENKESMTFSHLVLGAKHGARWFHTNPIKRYYHCIKGTEALFRTDLRSPR